MKAALLVSGNLGLECLKAFPDFCEIICIFTDKGSASILEFASGNNIPVFSGNPRNGKAREFIKNFSPDIVFSINYLFIIEKDVIDWPAKYCFNIHGSLLPKYRGRTPHVWSIINGETETGVTIHIVDEGCDTGNVVLQKKIQLNNDITGGMVLEEYYRMYPRMIKEVLILVKEDKIIAIPQDHKKATYFGIRTPESGRIDWNWQKQRIINWVRAQAKPYPQAFSFIDDSKIRINKMITSEAGFKDSDKNGLILLIEDGKPVVKTPNGAVKLEEFDIENKQPEAGNILV